MFPSGTLPFVMVPQTVQKSLVFRTVKSKGPLREWLGLVIVGVALPAEFLPRNCLRRQGQFHTERPAP